jgi:LPXTG-motif cell wall-anchored protein
MRKQKLVNGEKTYRVKLYKAGKFWLAMGMTSAALGVAAVTELTTVTVSADTSTAEQISGESATSESKVTLRATSEDTAKSAAVTDASADTNSESAVSTTETAAPETPAPAPEAETMPATETTTETSTDEATVDDNQNETKEIETQPSSVQTTKKSADGAVTKTALGNVADEKYETIKSEQKAVYEATGVAQQITRVAPAAVTLNDQTTIYLQGTNDSTEITGEFGSDELNQKIQDVLAEYAANGDTVVIKNGYQDALDGKDKVQIQAQTIDSNGQVNGMKTLTLTVGAIKDVTVEQAKAMYIQALKDAAKKYNLTAAQYGLDKVAVQETTSGDITFPIDTVVDTTKPYLATEIVATDVNKDGRFTDGNQFEVTLDLDPNYRLAQRVLSINNYKEYIAYNDNLGTPLTSGSPNVNKYGVQDYEIWLSDTPRKTVELDNNAGQVTIALQVEDGYDGLPTELTGQFGSDELNQALQDLLEQYADRGFKVIFNDYQQDLDGTLPMNYTRVQVDAEGIGIRLVTMSEPTGSAFADMPLEKAKEVYQTTLADAVAQFNANEAVAYGTGPITLVDSGDNTQLSGSTGGEAKDQNFLENLIVFNDDADQSRINTALKNYMADDPTFRLAARVLNVNNYNGYIVYSGNQYNQLDSTQLENYSPNLYYNVFLNEGDLTYGEATSTRTINFVNADGTPSILAPVTQTITYKTVTNDVANKTIYTPTGAYYAYDVPEVAGYVADLTAVPQVAVGATDTLPENQVVTVTYTPKLSYGTTTSTRTITFVNADGTKNDVDPVIQTVTYKTTTNEATGETIYTPTGIYATYTVPTLTGYVADQTEVLQQALGATNVAPENSTVMVTYMPKLSYGTSTSTRTITFVNNDGTDSGLAPVVQTVTYKTTTNEATGETIYTPTGIYAAYTVPTQAGYTADQTEVLQQALGATNTLPENKAVIVTYTKNAEEPDNGGTTTPDDNGTTTTPNVDDNGETTTIPGDNATITETPTANNESSTDNDGEIDESGNGEVSENNSTGVTLGDTSGSNDTNAQTVSTTSNASVVSLTQSTPSAKGSVDRNETETLPQTDDAESATAAVTGMTLLALLGGLLGLGAKKRRHNN